MTRWMELERDWKETNRLVFFFEKISFSLSPVLLSWKREAFSIQQKSKLELQHNKVMITGCWLVVGEDNVCQQQCLLESIRNPLFADSVSCRTNFLCVLKGSCICMIFLTEQNLCMCSHAWTQRELWNHVDFKRDSLFYNQMFHFLSLCAATSWPAVKMKYGVEWSQCTWTTLLCVCELQEKSKAPEWVR